MGSIYKRKSRASGGMARDVWYISYYDDTRTRHQEAVGPSRKQAEKALRQREAEIVARKFHYSEGKAPPFGEYADYWLANYSLPKNSPDQYQNNRERLARHLVPHFKDIRIDCITPRDIDQYIASKDDGLQPATINRTLSILSKMFNDAIRWGMLQSNPMQHVSKLREPQEGFSYLSEAEGKRLLLALSTDVRPIVATAMYTGMRAGEVYGLKWENVDLDRGIITVESSRDGPTKSRRVRYIPINPKLKIVLEAHRGKQDSDYVFPGPDGKMHYRDMRKELARACRVAGVKRIRFHDLRHTFASCFIQKSGNILSLQKLLGHSSLEMTLRYAHLAPDFLRKEMELVSFD